ncbi:low-density lipoprotein receptor-related protein 12-like [Asterias amurensis]|uniref:low-density lipoprotein receptor-related protein 12-like n=1 Tax=Asterias amurensis TaxID=7602 RepID=UPI003AB1C05A
MMKIAASLAIAVICATLFVATDAANDGYSDLCSTLRTRGFTRLFTCATQTDVCTHTRYECDSVIDCPDFSDEDHCVVQHAASCMSDFNGKNASNNQPLEMFRCDDGMCILGCYQCDNTQDCVDGSDERGCTENHIRPPCY